MISSAGALACAWWRLLQGCPASPSCAAEGTSTPPREARVGDPGGCAP